MAWGKRKLETIEKSKANAQAEHDAARTAAMNAAMLAALPALGAEGPLVAVAMVAVIGQGLYVVPVGQGAIVERSLRQAADYVRDRALALTRFTAPTEQKTDAG